MSTLRLRPWRLRTTARRSATQWRLLAVVATVATLACTLVTALVLLVSATEQDAVRSSLAAAPATDTEVVVTAVRPAVTTAELRSAVGPAVQDLLRVGTVTETGAAVSELYVVRRTDDSPALTYFADLDDLREHTALRAGAWPTTSQVQLDAATTALPVALAQEAAGVLGLGVGDTFWTAPGSSSTQVLVAVVGIYRTADPGSTYWQADPLVGAGHDPSFTVPGTGGRVTTDAFGPLVLAPAAIDELGIRLDLAVLRYRADFGSTAVGQVVPLLDRLATAQDDVPADVGLVADQVRLTTGLHAVVKDVATALVVTRATVVVVTLLLLVLAVAALLQTARLLTDSRLTEQRLMRARGASGRQLLSLAGLEAVGLGLLTAAAAPPLARWVHQVVARQPAMVAAGMSTDPGIPPSAWTTAAGVAVLFAGVLVSPLLRRGGTFVEGEQVRGRPSRRSMLQRSGVDLALLVLAGIAYWQLQVYRSPLGGGSSLAVDPVLAAGPAIALLAGALLCVRLIPTASHLAERIGSRGRGVVAPLAAWEVGRRTERATAAVLLLTLALSVGTFSQSFLATWRQSQADQAEFAVGTQVRVADGPGDPALQAAALGVGLTGAPQPVVRRAGGLASPDAFDSFRLPDGTPTLVLGLTGDARSELIDGRLAAEGGSAIAGLLDQPVARATGIDLTGDVRGISATVRAGATGGGLPGVGAMLRGIVEDADGLLTTIDLGSVPIDGEPHEVRGLLPEATGVARPMTPLRLVGLQAVVLVVDEELGAGNPGRVVDLTIKDLAVLEPAAETAPADPTATDGDPDHVATPIAVDESAQWYAQSRGSVPMSVTTPPGWQVGMRVSIPPGLERRPATVVQMGWAAVTDVPAVLTSRLADRLDVGPGDRLALVLDGTLVQIVVAGTTPRVPTADGQDTVVVDHTLLARALAQSGVAHAAVDEWWVDVPPEDAAAYLASLPTNGADLPGAGHAVGQVQLTRDMQEHPLRVATQGALWLVTLAAAILAAVGFAVHATATLRAREVEFAQLRAIGLSRRRLIAVVGVESLLLCVLGTAFGIGLGALLGWLVGPLVAVSADGLPPVPAVEVVLPWADIALLALEVVGVLALVVLVVGRMQRTADPASVLRLGDER
ncbi:ABC transporter permease [Cellulomonas sp. KRMCY2]|uniref:ABC transporter permease n=1 Tax=Cellulomonas sp. KRMCY2 TaxID=1304865 RepID=UPI00045E5C03|nr:ABC transporter permease [Cellulomonas sp. KRMCY2]